MERNEPRNPKQVRSIATKEQLFRAALELFEEEGYHRTTTKKIAARANIAVGSFYAYYRNKKAVFLEVIRFYYGRIAEEALGDLFPNPGGAGGPTGISEIGGTEGAAEIRGQDPREYLSAIIGQLYEAHDITPKLHREITGMRYSDAEVDRLIREEESKTIGRVQELLESLQPVLVVKDLEAAAHLLHNSTEELIHSIKIFGPPIEASRLLSELKEMVSRYLLGNEG
ncbi:MAG: TetR/AcrR family transcriptional regulator [Spirochaetaceae bacterium]